MICRRLALSAAVLAAAAAPTATAAVRPLPVGTDSHGVIARFGHATAVVTFTHAAAARYRRIAGRTVQVGCVAIVRTTHSGALIEYVAASQRMVAPRRRKPMRAFIGERGGRPDYCTVQLVRRHAPPTEIAEVPISARGATYLDERRTVQDILGVMLLADSPSGRPLSAARMQALSGGHVVPVSGPEQPPPPGHAGYWTDGSNDVYVGELTHYGTLFFFDSQINTDIVTTNMLDWLTGQNP